MPNMHEGRTVFAQLMDWLSQYELAKRDGSIFFDFAHVLIREVTELYADVDS